MAICDAHFVFTFADIRSYDSNIDSGIFKFNHGKKFLQSENECPSTGEFLYFLVDDGAFPRRPYPRHVST